MGDDTREQAEPGPTPYDAYGLLVRMIKEVKRQEKEIILLKAAVNTCLIDAREASARKDEEIERLKEERDGVYSERNQCVALLAKFAFAHGLRCGIAKTAIEGWDEAWHGCVYVDLPTGQVSWHYHDSEDALFSCLPAYEGGWDGHSTPEKYDRVNACYPIRPTAAVAENQRLNGEIARMREARAPFAAAAPASCIPDAVPVLMDGLGDECRVVVTCGHMRAARAALQPAETPAPESGDDWPKDPETGLNDLSLSTLLRKTREEATLPQSEAGEPVSKAREGRQAITHAVASLAAAISLLERTPKAKKAAPSDRMFDQMLKDYRKALAEARIALTSAPEPAKEFNDLRPAGWTEAKALSFIAKNGENPEIGMFAKAFDEGAWDEVAADWPDFVQFVEPAISASRR